ncbi:MAG: TIGR04282 family arsenosugar biosynthesis glycosyltransferase [Pseudomonadota bacterium]
MRRARRATLPPRPRPGPARRRRLVIFAKEPRAGRVKTRLGREIGMTVAAAWHRRRATELARRMAAAPGWECWLALSPDAAVRESPLWPARARRMGQGRGDLGRRMARVFRAGPPGPVVVIGADVPAIARADVAAAFRALGPADAVIGPAADGGYWLIGLRRSPRRAPLGLFEGVRWSTEHARADTEATLRGAGAPMRIARLIELRDVDRAADLAPAARERARRRL